MSTSAPLPFRLLREPPEAREPRWPLAFVIAALLALGLVPLAVGRRVAEVEREIDQVLEPARQHALDLALVHARQIARFQSYLMTGDELSLARYQEARASERASYDALVALADQLELDVRNKLAALYAVSSSWHVLHAPALASTDARLSFIADLTQERRRNEQLLEASRALTDAILESSLQGRARMEREREIQLWLTVVLVVVALAATALVAGIAKRLRSLVAEARDQRVRAVRARRQVDAVLEATGDGVLVLDRWGRCTSLNRAGARLLGYGESELQGRDVHDALHGGDPRDAHPPESCPIMRAVSKGVTVRETQDEFCRADGSAIPVQWTVGPLEGDLRIKGAVLTFTDMSEIRAAQEALQQAVRVRDEVVAVVSHDLRNPLGTIAAATGVVLELDLRPEQRSEHLRIVLRATERMTRLIEDLLDIARIEGGGLTLKPEDVPPDELVADALDLLRPQAIERGLNLSERIEPDLPRVRADRDRVLQVFSNLVGNALKFTREGGVGISVTGGVDGEDEVEFAVSDSGPGIDPEGLEHAFDRFWQLSRADRRGAGLGLAIARGIVAAHGGRIWVESRLGEGATFKFTLPSARPSVGAAQLDAARRAAGESRTSVPAR